MNFSPERNDLYSESAQWVPQYVLEEVMRAHAATLPSVQLRFATSYVGAEQGDGCVTSTVLSKKTGQNLTIRSAFLVGADGSRSAVRETIHATMVGTPSLAQNFNVQFRAPELSRLNPQGPAVMYYVVNDEVQAILGPMEDEQVWYFAVPHVPNTGVDPKDLIRRATNLDFEMEILGNSPWSAQSLIADKYSEDRILLAGDACHLHPPFGGYGMNMGVADGVDLGWKIAATLAGWGGAGLLRTYELERRPIHKMVIQEAVGNYKALGNHLTLPGIEEPGPEGDATRREAGDVIFAAKLREFKTLGVVLGYRYADSPIIVPDGTEPPEPHTMIYRPTAFPGCLAPHLWLKGGSSLYDLFGPGFTLLATGDESDGDLERAQKRAKACRLPLTVIQPKDSRLPRRYLARYALIRPDQHVAWRGDRLPDDLDALFECVTGRSLEPVEAQLHGAEHDRTADAAQGEQSIGKA